MKNKIKVKLEYIANKDDELHEEYTPEKDKELTDKLKGLERGLERLLQPKFQSALQEGISNSLSAMEQREPEMWVEYSSIKELKSILKMFSLKKSNDNVNKDTKYLVKKNGETILEFGSEVWFSVVAMEVAKAMHSVDSSEYYCASVEVTHSPVLIDGGSEEPQEIGIWSSDSVSTDDEFDFEGA